MIQEHPMVVDRWERYRLRYRVFGQIYTTMRLRTGSSLRALGLLRSLRRKYRQVYGEPMLTKVALVDGKYYWRMASPGFPSMAWDLMIESEIDRLFPQLSHESIRTIFLAITKKCTMNCEHCFEWDEINKPDVLSVNDILDILWKFNSYGTTQYMFSGGEPLLRYDDLLKILKRRPRYADYWIITSGKGMTYERALALKANGLTGVMVSLDHHEPEKNDTFRGCYGAFEMATDAVTASNRAGLITALSLCLTKNSANTHDFSAYMELAKSLGVAYVQVLEPRQKGRYAGKDVKLDAENIADIEKIYLTYNNSPHYSDYPIIHYLAYHQRRIGCFGAGDRFFYIDTNGDAHVCPYCKGTVISTIEYSATEVVEALKTNGCGHFRKLQVVQ